MNPYYPVKEEYCNWWSSSSSSASESSGSEAPIPKPIEGLHDAGPPPFLTKIYDMVDDQSIDHIVSWSRCGQSFVVWDVHAFSTNLLPKYFKHSNFSSFVRQLNTYGFRKIDPDVWEFANEAFSKGQRHNLKKIKRRKAPSQAPPPQQAIGPCVEVGRFGLDGEVERLRRDKQILLMELVKLRQQQQNTRAHLQAMELRLQGTERKQQKMMSFLAKAMQNPKFIQKLVQHGKRKELEEAIMKKRRRPIDQGPSGVKSGKKLIQNGDGSSKLIKLEPEEFGDPYGFQVSELEALALEMQGIGKSKRYNQEEQELSELEEFECEHKELDEEFWDELLSERYDEGLVANCNEEGEESDVNFLVDKLDFLRSSPK